MEVLVVANSHWSGTRTGRGGLTLAVSMALTLKLKTERSGSGCRVLTVPRTRQSSMRHSTKSRPARTDGMVDTPLAERVLRVRESNTALDETRL
jgi:hypothetical protein